MLECTQSDPLALPLFFFVSGFFVLVAYRAWFDTKRFREGFRKQVKLTPHHYPFREYYEKLIEKPSWVWQVRLVSAFSALASILAFILSILNHFCISLS